MSEPRERRFTPPWVIWTKERSAKMSDETILAQHFPSEHAGGWGFCMCGFEFQTFEEWARHALDEITVRARHLDGKYCEITRFAWWLHDKRLLQEGARLPDHLIELFRDDEESRVRQARYAELYGQGSNNPSIELET
jgi:hypothetical protein